MLWTIVDRSAEALGQPVLVDDTEFRFLAHSEHPAEGDEVRRVAILQRQASPAVCELLVAAGVLDLEAPAVIDEAPELGMRRRICAPVRRHGELLGFLWMIDAGRPLDEELLVVLGDVTAQLADAWPGPLRDHAEPSAQTDALVRLLAVDGARADALPDDHRLSALPSVVVHHVSVDGASTDASNLLAAALAQAEAVASPDLPAGSAVRGHEGWLVVAESVVGSGLARYLYGLVARRVMAETVIGVSDAGPPLDLPRLGRQARLAASHSATQGFGAVVRWGELGVNQLIAQVDGKDFDSVVHPGLRALLADGSCDELVHTLECFLELSGDIKRSAERLAVHRGTLYYRLKRIEELAAVNLCDGNDRLSLHLGLKVARRLGSLAHAEPAS
jgi:PucR C-terminal helix-turn-helix domain